MDAGPESEARGIGYVKFHLTMARAERPFGKSASADTVFDLDSAILILSAPGVPTQTHRYAFTGRADLTNLSGMTPVIALAPLRAWRAKVISVDLSTNPARRDTVHLDSLEFGVPLNDTAEVDFTVRPVYSILRVRLFSHLADSLPAGIKFVRLRVNGVTRDSVEIPAGGINHAVFFPTPATGWLVNDSGRVMKSTDSGNTWRTQPTNVAAKMTALWFNSATEGWAVGAGGTILKSNGSAWATQAVLGTDLNGVMFASATKGYAVGNAGRVFRTLDGGANWQPVSGGWFGYDTEVSGLNSVHFANALTGWAVANGGVILRTLNGGRSWSPQSSNTTGALRAVHAQSASIVVAVGDGGVIRRTTGGGTSTWTTISSGVATDLRDVHFANTTYGWAVGAGGVIRRSTNGGADWGSQSSGVATRLNAVASNGSSRVLVVGDNGEIRRLGSISGSGAFSDASDAVIGSRQLNGVTMVPSTNTAWVVGNGGFIAKSTNTSNDSWTRQGVASGVSVTTENLLHVHFADANNGWATGENGVILRTTNGGSLWTLQASGTTESLPGVHAFDDDSVYAVGAAGTFVKTYSGGAITTTSNNLNAVYFRGDNGYVVGDGGVAMRTTNAGATWSALTGGTQKLRSVFVSPSGNNVYAVGNLGQYLLTSNTVHVSNWTVKSSGTLQTLHSVWVSNDRIYAAGDNGVVRSATSPDDLDEGIAMGTTQSLRAVQCQGTTNVCWAVGGNEIVLRATNGTSWTEKTSGTKEFDQLLTYKYLKPGQSNTIVIQAIDRVSPLRGYQSTLVLNLGAGQDSTVVSGVVKCGYGGPSCTP